MSSAAKHVLNILLLTMLAKIVLTTPVPTSRLLSSIEEVNKKYANGHQNKGTTTSERAEKEVSKFDASAEKSEEVPASGEDMDDDHEQANKHNHRMANNFPFPTPHDLTGAAESEAMRENKMFGYYGFYPSPYPTAAAFYPGDYYDYGGYGGGGFGGGYGGLDFAGFSGFAGYNGLEEDDILGRNNQRRRPQGNTKNSPIYYIRLPPTPYMYVPGLGYISQPPTLAPISPVAPISSFGGQQYGGNQFGGNQYGGSQFNGNPYGASPFYNIPLNFLANGKPSSIYQWNGGPSIAPQYDMPYQQRPTYQQRPSYPQQQQPAYPQQQRPTYRPPNPYAQDSKITHLKGPFLFNGRPDDIFVLPNPYNQYNQYNQYNPYNQFTNPYHGFF
jgi:hypothetical protein